MDRKKFIVTGSIYTTIIDGKLTINVSAYVARLHAHGRCTHVAGL